MLIHSHSLMWWTTENWEKELLFCQTSHCLYYEILIRIFLICMPYPGQQFLAHPFCLVIFFPLLLQLIDRYHVQNPGERACIWTCCRLCWFVLYESVILKVFRCVSSQVRQWRQAMPFVRLRPTRLLLPWNLMMMASWQRYWWVIKSCTHPSTKKLSARM